MQLYGHKAADIEINLMSIHYVDGFALNLLDSYAGSMKAISSLEGVTNPVQKVEDLNISGIPAKRVSFTANRFGDVLCMESIYIIRGQHLWTVYTTFTDKNKEARPTVNSILSSISLQASP